MQLSDPATVLIISMAAPVIALTAFTLYTSFGPPATLLAAPFDEHDH